MRDLICMQKWLKHGNSRKWYVLLHHGLIQQIQNVSLHSTQRPEYYSTVALLFSKNFSRAVQQVTEKQVCFAGGTRAESLKLTTWGIRIDNRLSSGLQTSRKWFHSIWCKRWHLSAPQHKNSWGDYIHAGVGYKALWHYVTVTKGWGRGGGGDINPTRYKSFFQEKI